MWNYTYSYTVIKVGLKENVKNVILVSFIYMVIRRMRFQMSGSLMPNSLFIVYISWVQVNICFILFMQIPKNKYNEIFYQLQHMVEQFCVIYDRQSWQGLYINNIRHSIATQISLNFNLCIHGKNNKLSIPQINFLIVQSF